MSTKLQQIQTILGEDADDIWGPKSQAALDLEIQRSKYAREGKVDSRSETNIATLHPKVQPLARDLVRAAADEGITIKVTSGTRTYAEQDALYAQGRTKPGKRVTNAKGGFSNHNHGIAFDVTEFSKDGKTPIYESKNYKKVGEIGKSLGLSWGGDWTSPVDEPHFELKPEWADDLSESAMLSRLRQKRAIGEDAFA